MLGDINSRGKDDIRPIRLEDIQERANLTLKEDAAIEAHFKRHGSKNS